MHSDKSPSLKCIRYISAHFIVIFLLTACGNSEDIGKVKAAFEVNKLNISFLQITSPNSIIESAATEQFTAQAIIGDGSGAAVDISDRVKWSISDTTMASINASGLLTGKGDGMLTVSIQLADLSASKTIQLSAATLTGITISNNSSPVSVCRSGYQLTAIGTYDDASTRDITDLVSWSSDTGAILVINNVGAFATYAEGTVTVTATRTGITGSASVTVNNDIDSIQITPYSNTVNIGSTLSFTATGTYADATTHVITNTVTWSSDNADILTISNAAESKGIATGIALGTANISARCEVGIPVVSVASEISVTQAAVINAVTINEDTVSLEFTLDDSPQQLAARLKKNDNTYSTDVTDDDNTLWLISRTLSGEPLTISNTSGSKGEITFTAPGITEISVRYDDNDADLGPFEDTIEIEVLAN